jgi:lipoprotein-anchoring transpeptidase ErfK/SrfK
MIEALSITFAGAIASGAAAALKDTASAAIKDAYAAVKTLVSNRYKRVDVAQIEQEPASNGRQAVLTEELAKSGAENDGDLRRLVTDLVSALETHDESAGAAVGIDVKNLKAKLLQIGQVSEGTGIKADTAEIETIRVDQIGKKKLRTISCSNNQPRPDWHPSGRCT